MNQSNWMIVLSQLAGQAPVLLVYLAGLVIAAIYLRRAPLPAMLAMLGVGLLLLSMAIGMWTTFYMMNNRGAVPASTLAVRMGWIGIGNSVLRALGMGLLLAGVFVGRPHAAERGAFEVQPPQMQ